MRAVRPVRTADRPRQI